MYLYSTLILFLSAGVQCSSPPPDQAQNFLIKKLVKECIGSNNHVLCFANKAAKVLDRSMNWDIRFFDEIKFVRNKAKLSDTEARTQPTGFGRFTKVLADFLNTHTLSVDLTDEVVEGRSGDGGGGGGGLFGGYDKAALRKEGKYVKYAFMVLLGIFGLTGPLIMKTLAVMAAKSLIASKMALIIVGSVALKKIFDKEDHHPSIKVHTVTADDEHDRIFTVKKPLHYWAYGDPYSKPT